MALIGRRGIPLPDYSQIPLGLSAPTPAPALPVAPNLTPPDIPKPKQGVNWLGVLADALSGAAGQPGMYAHEMMRQRDEQTAFERGEQTWQQHHKQEVADQMGLLDYKRSHPDDEFTRLMDSAGVPLADRPAHYTRMLNNKENPVHYYIDQATGQPMMIGGASQMPLAPPKASDLTPLPLGGPTQPASGGFPRKY